MKAKKLLFSIAIVLLILSSCDKVEFGNDFLEKEPSGGDVTKDTIFNSLELSKRYLTSGYKTLRFGLPMTTGGDNNGMGTDVLESLTDLNQSYMSWSGSFSLYYSIQYNAGIESSSSGYNTKYNYTRERSWEGIRIGWNFIENADRIPDATTEIKEQLKAEAKMIIAMHYTDMYRNFGGLPWVDHAYSPTESTNLPRLTSLQTMKKIVALIDEAIPHLPWAIAAADLINDDGRFTQASAKGLKARVLLFGASPLFNDGAAYLGGEASSKFYTWHGGYDASLWNDAAEAAKDLLDDIDAKGGYGLVNTGNPRMDFQNAYYKRGNGEVLISVRNRYKSSFYWDSAYYFYQAAAGYGITCPTKEYVDMFPMANGLAITDPNSGYDPDYPWKNRDPRLYETVLVNGDTFIPGLGGIAAMYIDGQESKNTGHQGRRTGFGLRKFLLDTNSSTSNATGTVTQWPYLRLAEIYLSYAEAANEANGGPTAEAYAAVNKVRNRVQMPNEPNDLKPGLSKEQFRKAILTERALEFGYEEVRWFDIVRWKMADVFKQKLHGVNTYSTNAPANTTFRYETKDLPERKWSRDEYWSPKWYLSAFPSDEVNKGYGLTQNPGWE